MPKYPVAGPVNTASSLSNGHAVTDFRKLNCAACTAGALTGRPSGVVIGQLFQGLDKPKKVVAGYEPDIAFTLLGKEARQRKGKGPKFAAPPAKPGEDATQRQANVDAAIEESGLHAQVKALKHWVSAQRGGTCDQHGSVKTLIEFTAARLWMATKPSWTEFAVYFTSFAAPTPGHWVYAENRSHTVEFVDYQQYLPGGNRPDSTTYPSCEGGAAPDAKMLVLSFSR